MAIDRNLVEAIVNRLYEEDGLVGSGSSSIVMDDLTIEYNYNVQLRYDPTPTDRGEEPYWVVDTEWFEVTDIFDEDGEEYPDLVYAINKKLARL